MAHSEADLKEGFIGDKYSVSRGKGQGCCSRSEIIVSYVDGDTSREIGSYLGNPKNYDKTFYPFVANGKELALYSSAENSDIRIAHLSDTIFKDIGGIAGSSENFYVTQLFVPFYRSADGAHPDVNDWVVGRECFDAQDLKDDLIQPIQYANFGFVAGHGVQEQSPAWYNRIQFLDLSEANKGVIRREDRLGNNVLLPRGMDLESAVDMTDWRPESTKIVIAQPRRFDYGKKEAKTPRRRIFPVYP